MRSRAFGGTVVVHTVLVLIMLTACGGPQAPQGPKPPGSGSATLPAMTKVLGDAARASLTSVSGDGEYVFAQCGKPTKPTPEFGLRNETQRTHHK